MFSRENAVVCVLPARLSVPVLVEKMNPLHRATSAGDIDVAKPELTPALLDDIDLDMATPDSLKLHT